MVSDGKILVPSAHVAEVALIVHTLIGHRGVLSTVNEFNKRFTGINVHPKVAFIVQKCTSCWEKDRKIATNKGHVHVPRVTTAVNEILWVDIMGPLKDSFDKTNPHIISFSNPQPNSNPNPHQLPVSIQVSIPILV